ncbi:MAG TPA: family 1 glycosylhydrolase [Acidimicrobiales bacterium]|nr:family 1 glycosylhydrolase [Acidimicrobiales bacterium]
MPPATPARKAPVRKRAPARAKAPAKGPAKAPAKGSAKGPAKAPAKSAEANDLLGEGFLVGVATSGFQIEGGFNGPDEPHNNWAGWEAMGRIERSGLACDFWRHPEEALDRAAALGCNTFRLSVEWARLEPAPEVFDAAALERYAEILSMCVARGLAPMVTLHHFTNPVWQGEEFWLRPGSPDVFARHVRRILPALVPYCRHWVTINEPNIVMLMGWVEGAAPPGRRMAVSDAYCVLDNLLCAHVLAADAIAEVQPEAEVTMNTSSSSIYEHDRMLVDLLQLREAGIDPSDVDTYVDERRTVHDVAFPPRHAGEAWLRRFFAAVSPYGTDRPPGSTGAWAALRGRTRRQVPRRVVDVVGASSRSRVIDAAGFDWYDPIASHAMRVPGRRVAGGGGRDWSFGRALWDTMSDPAALGSWCATEAALRPGLPLWVVENGMATRAHDGRTEPREDGMDRPRYVREHLGAIADAVAAGVPVRAYLHWSLVDNYEWGSYEPRFGLFGLDRSDPATVRWLDTDSSGADAAGEFSRVVAGLRAGDRTVLEASR